MAVRRRVSGTTVTVSVVIFVVMFRAIQEHPAVVIVGAITAGTILVAWRHGRGRGRRSAVYQRSVTVTDNMTGTEFEQYVAQLMRASGMTQVKVSGGAGDLGADIVGRTAEGHRIVVQCKRHRANVGSPHVQRFAGTVFSVHRAEVAMMVTTTGFTEQARGAARLCRITLVDRGGLSRWIRTREAPTGLTLNRRVG